MTGIDRINTAFSNAKSQNRAAFMPYHPLGYPDRDAALAAVKTLATSGAGVGR